MRLTAAFEMMLGNANRMHVKFVVVAFVGCCCRCGLRRGDCHCTGVVAGIGGTVPGMLFLVRHMWVQGLVRSVCLLIVFVDVITGGDTTTL